MCIKHISGGSRSVIQRILNSVQGIFVQNLQATNSDVRPNEEYSELETGCQVGIVRFDTSIVRTYLDKH